MVLFILQCGSIVDPSCQSPGILPPPYCAPHLGRHKPERHCRWDLWTSSVSSHWACSYRYQPDLPSDRRDFRCKSGTGAKSSLLPFICWELQHRRGWKGKWRRLKVLSAVSEPWWWTSHLDVAAGLGLWFWFLYADYRYLVAWMAP